MLLGLEWALLVGLSAVLVILLLPCLSDLWSLLAKSVPLTREASPGAPRLLFLIPAHDEAGLIASCVQSIVNAHYPRDLMRVVVIADNCHDETAALARAGGAEVLERDELQSPGKPRALAWALERLKGDPWDACVIIDADTQVDPEFARALASEAPLAGIGVQAYFGTLNEYDTWLTRLAGVLARCRYEVTYPLKQRAGLNCPLTGNGMCIGRDLLSEGWQAFSLTENWELYASLTSRGVAIRYSRGAVLFSDEARSMNQGSTQRRRWLAGRLGVLRDWCPRVLQSNSITWHQKLDALAELASPGPVLHLLLAIAVAGSGWLAIGGALGWWVVGLAALSISSQVFATTVVMCRHPQKARTIAAFAMLPIYAIWRAMVAVGTVATLNDVAWRKTNRR